MLIDYHMHTRLCRHATGEVEEYLRQAVCIGLDEIGFADHCPLPRGYDPKYRMDISEFPHYRAWIRDLQARGGSVTVRYGIEADWVPGHMDEVWQLLDSEGFDYILGSVHYVDELPFDDPPSAHLWQDPDLVEHIWRRYGELMLDLAKSNRFDIFSHFDLPKKFGWFPKDRRAFVDQAAAVFELAAEHGMAIEINTAGLRKKVGEIYPSLSILERAAEAGMGLSFGSDAHAPGEVGMDFDAAVELARRAGFTHFRSYEKRQFREHPLPC